MYVRPHVSQRHYFLDFVTRGRESERRAAVRMSQLKEGEESSRREQTVEHVIY